MTERAKMMIEWENKAITFEGPMDFIEQQAKLFKQLETKPLGIPYPHVPAAGSSPANFVAQKQPKGHHEVVAVLAFLLQEEGKTEFTELDIKRAYIQSGVRPPKVIAQALRDAKNKFDYIESTKTRGVYRLSPHGDRTVRFDMPRSAS